VKSFVARFESVYGITFFSYSFLEDGGTWSSNDNACMDATAANSWPRDGESTSIENLATSHFS